MLFRHLAEIKGSSRKLETSFTGPNLVQISPNDGCRSATPFSRWAGPTPNFDASGAASRFRGRRGMDSLDQCVADDKPRDSGGERRFCEAPPGAGVDIGAYGPTISARRSRNGIKKLSGEAKREICRTSKRRARKLRKRVDHQKEADCNPHQQSVCRQRIGDDRLHPD